MSERGVSVKPKEGTLHLFIDNSNVLIEAQRASETRRKGLARLGKYTDPSYQIDWGKFIYLVKQKVSCPSRKWSDPPLR